MTLPSIVLGFVISTLYGAAFHLWRGGGAGRLLLYLIYSWTGFCIGNALAGLVGWDIGQVGPLKVLFASVFSLIALGLGHWLSFVEVKRN